MRKGLVNFKHFLNSKQFTFSHHSMIWYQLVDKNWPCKWQYIFLLMIKCNFYCKLVPKLLYSIVITATKASQKKATKQLSLKYRFFHEKIEVVSTLLFHQMYFWLKTRKLNLKLTPIELASVDFLYCSQNHLILIQPSFECNFLIVQKLITFV